MAVWQAVEGPGDVPVPVLFLDRDGVVIRDQDYLSSPDGVEVLPGVAAAMVRARSFGFRLVGLSNQSGIGRGYYTAADFGAVMDRLAADLASSGAAFDGFYYCPHGPDEGCDCRKPAPGLLTEAAAGLGWDAARSWVIGDKASDVALGRAAGLGAVLVLTGYGMDAQAEVRRRWPQDDRVLVAADLPAAVAMILARTAVDDDLAD
jgi:D-glycero-D-manno-heptose 1,7-bisphosphate phosphatase